MSKIAIVASIDFLALLNDTSRSLGGTASVIKNIIYHLSHERIVCFGVTDNKKLINKEIVIDSRISIYSFILLPKSRRFPKRIAVFLKGIYINKALSKFDIDSVYSHCVEISFWISKKYWVVEHMHGAENAVARSTFSILQINIFKSMWSFIREKSIKKCNKIVAIDAKCLMLAAKHKKPEDILSIPNFVDENLFYFDRCGTNYIKTDKKIILFVGRIEAVKGLDLFIDIVADLNSESHDWLGVIVGSGSVLGQLKKYATESNCHDSVCFLGPIYDTHTLRKIYSQADTFLLTSHYEGVPMCVLEALACGTPVVATDVGGVSALSDETDTICKTVKSRNKKEFSRSIRLVSGKRQKIEPNTFSLGVKKKVGLISSLLSSP